MRFTRPGITFAEKGQFLAEHDIRFLVGEPDSKEGPRGFFRFYKELWDEKELGPRPIADPLKLLARNADGTPMASKNYSIGKMREFTACLNNPHWRAVLKAWAKRCGDACAAKWTELIGKKYGLEAKVD